MKQVKRKYKRKHTVVLLDVSYEKTPDETKRAAIVDISLGGCQFETRAEFEKGNRVVLRFTVGKNKVYIIVGEIKRISAGTGTYMYGVKFDEGGFFEKLKRKQLIKKIS